MKTTSRVIWLMDFTYAYDHRGRMVYKPIGTIGLEQDKTISYLWDDYNIIAETVVQGGVTSVTCNVWGLDISGTMQGAGGVGGLLLVVRDGEPFFPCYDANGNITEYLDTNGVIVAHYEYDPFGNIIVQSGALAATFTHRFSTKPWCEVTGLSEYVYRKYSPPMGRWLSRDPIGEEVFLNHYNDLIIWSLPQTARAAVKLGGINAQSRLRNHVARSNANAYLGMNNNGASNIDLLGLKCIVYLMIGHFGVTTNSDGTVTSGGDIWSQLGTSTFQIDDNDAVFSMSCHMVSFIQQVQQQFPGVTVPDNWPPSPYTHNGFSYIGDFVYLLNEKKVHDAVRNVVSKLHKNKCCPFVEVRARCDSTATAALFYADPKNSPTTGTLKTINPCANGGFTKIFTRP